MVDHFKGIHTVRTMPSKISMRLDIQREDGFGVVTLSKPSSKGPASKHYRKNGMSRSRGEDRQGGYGSMRSMVVTRSMARSNEATRLIPVRSAHATR